MPNAFASYLEKKRPIIDAYLAEHGPKATADAEARDLSRYLYGPLAHFTAEGGKRTRPALCLLGAELVGAPFEVALPVADAIETFQSAALIHDDIADKSELRRGEPCLHITEGVGVATNVGDLALVNVFAQVLRAPEYPQPTRLSLLEEILQMEERTLEGQALDLGWARDGRWDVTVDDYLYMATHKTAFYSAATPLAAGAICGGGTNDQVEALRAFGMRAGLAFQLQDDLLNLVGDASRQGKDYRSDITEGKRTLCVVWALAHLEAAPRAELVQILESGTTEPAELARAVELMKQAGAIEHARHHARMLADEAKDSLGSVPLDPAAREVLLAMADFFVQRMG